MADSRPPMVGYPTRYAAWVRAEANIDVVNQLDQNWRAITCLKWGVDMRRVRDDLLQAQFVQSARTVHLRT